MSAPPGKTPETKPALFALEGVSRRYLSRREATLALDDLSLSFAGGTVTALVGSSGSGKSTLLRLLLGLERPDRGRVCHAGAEVRDTDLPRIRRAIGYVIQGGGLFPHLKVRANLALLPRHLGWSQAAIDARLQVLTPMVRLDPRLLGRYPAELSGGERQRVALLRALMTDPPALLLDEPLGALDPIIRHALQDELRELFRTLGKTVILVTHDLAEAAYLAPRLVLLRAGRVVQDGSLDEWRARPADGFVRRFLAAQRPLPA